MDSRDSCAARNLKNVSVVLFDLDNTLVPTRHADEKTCQQILELMVDKWQVPEELAYDSCQRFLQNFRQCPDNPQYDLDQWRTWLWRSALHSEYQDVASEIYASWKELRYSHLKLSTDVTSFLQKLRQNQYSVALITNGPSRSQWEKIVNLDADGMFDLILVSGDLEWEKPQAEIFHMACTRLQVGPQQCIMVGDRLETDILGGKKAGLAATVWIPLTYKMAQYGCHTLEPDFTIENVVDLAPMLGIHN